MLSLKNAPQSLSSSILAPLDLTMPMKNVAVAGNFSGLNFIKKILLGVTQKIEISPKTCNA